MAPLTGADDTVGESALARSLGMTEGEVDVVGEVVGAQLTAMGLDGDAVFARIRAGEPLGKALGFPKGTADLLYFRAYNFLQVGRSDKAEPLFRALCILDGREADYWVGYGLCLRERKATRRACSPSSPRSG